jgi:hypothetical protein
MDLIPIDIKQQWLHSDDTKQFIKAIDNTNDATKAKDYKDLALDNDFKTKALAYVGDHLYMAENRIEVKDNELTFYHDKYGNVDDEKHKYLMDRRVEYKSTSEDKKKKILKLMEDNIKLIQNTKDTYNK